MACVWYLFYPEGSGEGLSPPLHGFISLTLNQTVYASPITNKFVCFTERHCWPLCTTFYFPSAILTLTSQLCYVLAAMNGAGQPCFMLLPLSGPWLLHQQSRWMRLGHLQDLFLTSGPDAFFKEAVLTWYFFFFQLAHSLFLFPLKHIVFLQTISLLQIWTPSMYQV